MKLKDQWPSIYQKFLSTSILDMEVKETQAHCENCPKYLQNLKCCTFHPFFPNFLVGGILASQELRHSKAQALIRSKIKNKEYALPIGLVAPPTYQIPFNKNKSEIFGKDEKFLCPFFDRENKNCGVWIYRGSVCTSYHCVSDWREKGIEFWKRLSDFQSYLEMLFMEEALVELGYGPREVSEQVALITMTEDDFEGPQDKFLDDKSWKKFWSHHEPDPELFYRRSWEFAQNFDREHFHESWGELGERVEESLKKIFAELPKKNLGS